MRAVNTSKTRTKTRKSSDSKPNIDIVRKASGRKYNKNK